MEIINIQDNPQFAYLHDGNNPRMVREAIRWLGVAEYISDRSNPDIISWATEIGGEIERQFKTDNIAWCGLFVSYLAHKAGKELPAVSDPKITPLAAFVWRKFGTLTDTPMLGDVLYFRRKGGGHVALYVGETATHYLILGGNQNNKVSIVQRKKTQLVMARRTPYKKQPDTVRRIFLRDAQTITDQAKEV